MTQLSVVGELLLFALCSLEKSTNKKASDGEQGGYKMMGVVLVNIELIVHFWVRYITLHLSSMKI
jgi:hypothetical protein